MRVPRRVAGATSVAVEHFLPFPTKLIASHRELIRPEISDADIKAFA